MSMEPQVRYFLGANSPSGFYSLYDELMDPAGANTIFILKGGPGCGKSTLMRQVATALEAEGQSVEYILCSGDPDSLDGVIFPKLKAAIVDGTAPHVVEPQFPGVVERYVNLGECYDTAGLGDARSEIMGCMAGYRDCYRRAYRCLTAAASVADDMRALLVTPAVEAKIARRVKGILSREIPKVGGQPGRVTRRFLSAITCRGLQCSFGTAEAQCKRIYELADSYGLAHLMLRDLMAGAVAAGHDVIACPSPMAPHRLEHLLIPSLSLAFLTSAPSLPYETRPYRRIRLDAMADAEALRRSKARLRFSRRMTTALTLEAVDSLAQAKTMHDTLEALYNPYVDFEEVSCMAAAIIEELVAK